MLKWNIEVEASFFLNAIEINWKLCICKKLTIKKVTKEVQASISNFWNQVNSIEHEPLFQFLPLYEIYALKFATVLNEHKCSIVISSLDPFLNTLTVIQVRQHIIFSGSVHEKTEKLI